LPKRLKFSAAFFNWIAMPDRRRKIFVVCCLTALLTKQFPLRTGIDDNAILNIELVMG